MARGKRRKWTEEDNTDRWVISYADFITLLFAFFTVLFASSNVDQVKLQKLTGSIKNAFKVKTPEKAANSVIEGIKPLNYKDVSLEKDVRAALEKSGKIEGINITRDERGVIISFEDSLLFDAGLAELRGESRQILASVAAVLGKVRNNIVIEGHTDNSQTRSARYPSNWELSTARATSVLVFLLKEHNLNPERFSVSGYGEYKPIASNVIPDGRARNRRVDIIFVTM